MDPKELYEALKRLEILEAYVNGNKGLKPGDKKVSQYNALLYSLPELLSFEDLKGYHDFLIDKEGALYQELSEEARTELEEASNQVGIEQLFYNLEELRQSSDSEEEKLVSLEDEKTYPPFLSAAVLWRYHNFLVQKYEVLGSEAGEKGSISNGELKTQLKERTLKALQVSCSPQAYVELERIIVPVFDK